MPLVRQCDLQALLWCQELSPSNEDLLCGVCLSLFDRRRVFLHCRHSFCQACVAQLRRPVRDGSVVCCPLCRLITPFSPQNPLEPHRELHRQLVQTKRRAYTHQVIHWIPIPEPLRDLIKARPPAHSGSEGVSAPAEVQAPEGRPSGSTPAITIPGSQQQPVAPVLPKALRRHSSADSEKLWEPSAAQPGQGSEVCEAPDGNPYMQHRRRSSAVSLDSSPDWDRHDRADELGATHEDTPGPEGLKPRKLEDADGRDAAVGVGHRRRRRQLSESPDSRKQPRHNRTTRGPQQARWEELELRKQESELRPMRLGKRPSAGHPPKPATQQDVAASAARKLRQELLAIAERKNVRLRCVFRHPSAALLGFQLPGITPQQQHQMLQEHQRRQQRQGGEALPRAGPSEMNPQQVSASVQVQGEDLHRVLQQRAIARAYETEAALCPACGVNHVRAEREIKALQKIQQPSLPPSPSELPGKQLRQRRQPPSSNPTAPLRPASSQQLQQQPQQQSQTSIAEELHVLAQACLREHWVRDAEPMLELRGRWIDVADAKQQMLVALKAHRELAHQRRSLWNRLWSWVRQALGCGRAARAPTGAATSSAAGSDSVASGPGKALSGAAADLHKNPRPQRAEPLEAGSDNDEEDGSNTDEDSEFEIEGDEEDDAQTGGLWQQLQLRSPDAHAAEANSDAEEDGGNSCHTEDEASGDVSDDDIVIGEIPLAPLNISQIPFPAAASMMMP